jgi:alpha-galactosidase
MPVAASVHGLIGFNDTTEEKLTALAASLAVIGLPLDTFWLDAGWNTGGFPHGQGDPEADAKRFPRGLAPVGEAARQAKMRFLAWFEPERAMPGTWLEREHPAWLLQPSDTPPELRYQEKDGFHLLDLGNPEARRWAAETVSKQIREAGIGIYRQDCNLYPAFFWRTAEETNRIGLREIGHIAGLHDYLDELAHRHPDLILDNCASGGRRLDFEMMRRCVALWRSDSCWGQPNANQFFHRPPIEVRGSARYSSARPDSTRASIFSLPLIHQPLCDAAKLTRSGRSGVAVPPGDVADNSVAADGD